jgi:hypothetical protein
VLHHLDDESRWFFRRPKCLDKVDYSTGHAADQ